MGHRPALRALLRGHMTGATHDCALLLYHSLSPCLDAGGLGSPHPPHAGRNSRHPRGRIMESAPPQGNTACSSAFAMQNVKANVHQVRVGLTNLAYMIYAIAVHAEDLAR